jgi:hypothetical protein
MHKIGLFLSALLCLLVHMSAQAQQPSSLPKELTAFVNVHVVPMDENRTLRGQTVVVEEGMIKAIGRRIRVPDGARIIDGKGRLYLSPGLADMHNHSDTRDDLILYLANGVTAMLNMGEARNSFVGRTRIAVNRGEIPGPHVYVALAVDGSPQYGHLVVATPEEARAAVLLAKANGYDFIKVYNNLKADVFDALAAEGRLQGIPLVGHGVTSVGIERQLAAGQPLVAHAEEFFYTFFTPPGAELNDAPPPLSRIPDAIALIKRHNAFVTADLDNYSTIAEQFGRPDVVAGYLKEPVTRYLAPADRVGWINSGYQKKKVDLAARTRFLRIFIKAMADAGVPLITGGDAPAVPGLVPGFSMHDNLRALEQAGLSRFQILSAATRIPGEFIARSGADSERFGTVAVGNRADLILSARNPLDDLSTLETPEGVMARGRWYSATELQALLDGVASRYEKASLAN